MSRTLQRVVGVLGLLGAGVLSLPLSAAVLDNGPTESWIIPVQMLVMAMLGAAAAIALPALAPAGTSSRGRALIGAVWGLLAALTALVVFWLLLAGPGGP